MWWTTRANYGIGAYKASINAFECMPHKDKDVSEEHKQEQAVLDRLAVYRKDEGFIYQLAKDLFECGNQAIFPLDFLTYGAIQRSFSTISAIGTLVEQSNMLAARAILRVHIDTVLRYAAAWFVDNPHEFASKVHEGKRIDKMKDSQGQQLRDKRLVELLTPDHPWLPTVYERLSGYIHLSESHISSVFTNVNKESRKVSFEFGKYETKYPTESWIEVMDCAHDATEILAKYIKGWIWTKSMKPEEFEALKKAVKAKTPQS